MVDCTQQIQPDDEYILNQFMPAHPPHRVTLADVIMGKIREQETEIASQMTRWYILLLPANFPFCWPSLLLFSYLLTFHLFLACFFAPSLPFEKEFISG